MYKYIYICTNIYTSLHQNNAIMHTQHAVARTCTGTCAHTCSLIFFLSLSLSLSLARARVLSLSLSLSLSRSLSRSLALSRALLLAHRCTQYNRAKEHLRQHTEYFQKRKKGTSRLQIIHKLKLHSYLQSSGR